MTISEQGDTPVVQGRWTPWVIAPALVAGLALAAALSGSAAHGASPAKRPNIVVIMTDDQTVESLRVMPNVRTLLGDRGVTFTNSFVSYSLCCPSRSTFLTGQYAHNHGVWGNELPTGGYDKLDHTNTLAVWLQRAGYQTIHLGKYLNGYGASRPTEIPPGWGDWQALVTLRYLGYRMNENGRLVNYGSDEASYQTDVLGRKAVEIIGRQAVDPRPFFLWVAFFAPHANGPADPDDPARLSTPSPARRHRNLLVAMPLPKPPSFNEADVSDKPAAIRNRRAMTARKIAAVRENYQQRLESLLSVDEAVAEIVGALGKIGELDNTYIIFTSDNGFFHGEHRVAAGKVLLYEPSIRVPLILRGPRIPQGQRRDEIVANIDLAPTIVEETRSTPGRVMDGRSLIPFARDPLLHSGRDLLLETPTYAAIRTPRWVYAEHVTGEQELYNLERDPDELVSLHANPAYARTKADLALRLARLRTCTGTVCRREPQLRLEVGYRHGRGPRRECSGSAARVAVGGSSARHTSQVRFYVDSLLIRSDLRAPFTAVVPGRSIRPAGSALEAVVRLADSRRMTLVRRLRACPAR